MKLKTIYYITPLDSTDLSAADAMRMSDWLENFPIRTQVIATYDEFPKYQGTLNLFILEQQLLMQSVDEIYVYPSSSNWVSLLLGYARSLDKPITLSHKDLCLTDHYHTKYRDLLLCPDLSK